MSTMLWDPMIEWPEVPTISGNIQYFINDGIIIHGGTKGPFKLNGKKAISTTIALIELLKINERQHVDFINSLYEKKDGQYLIHLYTILNKNGCIQIESKGKNRDLNIQKLNSYVNNYKNEEDILNKYISTNLKISMRTKELKYLFHKSNFNTNDEGEPDWEIKEVENINDIIYSNRKHRTILFANTDKGLIVGPIISDDAIERDIAAKYYSQLKIKKIGEKTSYIELVYLIISKVVLKLAEYNLEKGLYRFFNYKTEFIDILELYKDSELNLIRKFDLCTDFSSGKYSNKNGHFAHYKTSNVKLSKTPIDTEFFRVFSGSIPHYLSKIFRLLGGFKDTMPYKKYVPTGGEYKFQFNLLRKLR